MASLQRIGKYAIAYTDTISYTGDGSPVDKSFTITHNLGTDKVGVNYMQDYLTAGIYGGKELTSLDNNTLKITFKNCIASGNTNVVLQCVIYVPHSIQFLNP